MTRCATDANPCTDDTCDEFGVCVFTPDDTNSCDDGVFCNGSESCFDGFCGGLSACPPFVTECASTGPCDEENDACPLILDDSLCNDGITLHQ